ncbi:MAG: hypothetical protein ACR2OO_06560, partial [Thermomicrobiales bacterium]
HRTGAPEGTVVVVPGNAARGGGVLVLWDGGPSSFRDLTVAFDLSGSLIGTPQWGPTHAAPAAGPATVSGTGLDAGVGP